MYIPSYTIPKNDLLIKPNKIYEIIKVLLDYEIEFYSHNEKFVNLLNTVKKNMLDKFKRRYTWQTEVLSEQVCEHLYGEKSKKYGQICGRRIDINFDGKNYKCAKHIGIKHKPKARNIPENIKCKSLKKNGHPCSMYGKIKYGGNCVYHFKEEKTEILQDKVIILENENNLLNTEENCKNSKELVRTSININSLYNIIEKLNENTDFIEKKEIIKNISSEDKPLIKDLKSQSTELNSNINNFKIKLKIMREVLNTKYCSNNNYNNIYLILISSFSIEKLDSNDILIL